MQVHEKGKGPSTTARAARERTTRRRLPLWTKSYHEQVKEAEPGARRSGRYKGCYGSYGRWAALNGRRKSN